MTDRQPYDPDRMNLNDIDPDDVETLMEWADHPNTIAMADDYGRAFREQPAAIQIAEITKAVNDLKQRHAQVVDWLSESADPAVTGPLEELRDALEGHIASGNARLTELGGEPV